MLINETNYGLNNKYRNCKLFLIPSENDRRLAVGNSRVNIINNKNETKLLNLTHYY